jgi:RNA 2',3'-cyclic 3'-phosphodiesterase
VSSLRRGFVALVPPADVLDHVEAAVAPLRAEFPVLRWMPRAQWHVTLQFLGRVADTEPVIAALRGAVADTEEFVARMGGGGAFARSRSGTVLWLGVTEGRDAMAALAGALVRATEPLGFAPEDRPFRAHLTVARAPRPADLRGGIAAIDAAGTGPAWLASEIVLFDSDTRPSGAVHTEIARFPLVPRSQ